MTAPTVAGGTLRSLARKSTRDFPRLYQFAVVVLIVGVLALFVMRSLGRAQESVEEAAVQAEVAALRIELLDVLAHHEAVGGELPSGNNPLRWVERQIPAYLGEFDVAPQARGVWYFDRPRGELVYRFRNERESRFRLVRGAEAAGAPGTLAGVGLRRVGAPAAAVNSGKGQ